MTPLALKPGIDARIPHRQLRRMIQGQNESLLAGLYFAADAPRLRSYLVKAKGRQTFLHAQKPGDVEYRDIAFGLTFKRAMMRMPVKNHTDLVTIESIGKASCPEKGIVRAILRSGSLLQGSSAAGRLFFQ